MKGILVSEYERTFKRKKTIIGLIIYCIVLAFECLFLYGMNGLSFYDPEHSVQLNSINTAPFFIREVGIFINFILIPMLVVDSFNGEYTSGALRLVLIRPQARLKLFLAKWVVQASIFLGITIITWITSTLFGRLVMEHVSETTFFHTGKMDAFQGMIYTLKFYSMTFLIFLSVIGLCSLISVIMPNSILAFVGTIGCLVGGVYISDHFVYLLSVSDSIFSVLGGIGQSGFYVSLFLLFFISTILNVGIWKKKQWMG